LTGQYDGSTYPEGFRWAWLFREQRSVFATVGSPCPLYNAGAQHRIGFGKFSFAILAARKLAVWAARSASQARAEG
jgi:hypothetical protein